MSDTIRVYDPTGHAPVEQYPLAPLPASLDGLRRASSRTARPTPAC